MQTVEEEKLKVILSERWYRLHKGFVWTPENKKMP